MIVLINGGPKIDRYGVSPYLGRLVSPRSGNAIRPGERWAGDNDAFLAWDEERFVRMLVRMTGTPECLFVVAPDVVANARETLERFWNWRLEIIGRGFPVAFVGQDGAENGYIPWEAFDAWFIGGSTKWKLSLASADLASEAKQRGKWLHMGRVNTKARLRAAYDFGCDSVDGTGWSRFPDHYLKNHLSYVVQLHQQRSIFDGIPRLSTVDSGEANHHAIIRESFGPTGSMGGVHSRLASPSSQPVDRPESVRHPSAEAGTG